MRQKFTILAIAVLFLASASLAFGLATNFYTGYPGQGLISTFKPGEPYPPYYGYSGETSRDRRYADPFSREQYFGTGYRKPLVTYGKKGPYVKRNLGAKGVGSAAFNLDTNAFSPQGRNPGRISNFDPRMRGYTRRDVAVDLLPYQYTTSSANGLKSLPKGTARILSFGGPYGTGQNKAVPRGEVYIQLRDLPPAGNNHVYEVWLGDEDTGYDLALGLLDSVGVSGTAQLRAEIARLLDPFDYVMVTREPFPDNDPRPGEIVLVGGISAERTDMYQPASQPEVRLR